MEGTRNPLRAMRGALCAFLKVLFQATLSDRNHYSDLQTRRLRFRKVRQPSHRPELTGGRAKTQLNVLILT